MPSVNLWQQQGSECQPVTCFLVSNYWQQQSYCCHLLTTTKCRCQPLTTRPVSLPSIDNNNVFGVNQSKTTNGSLSTTDNNKVLGVSYWQQQSSGCEPPTTTKFSVSTAKGPRGPRRKSWNTAKFWRNLLNDNLCRRRYWREPRSQEISGSETQSRTVTVKWFCFRIGSDVSPSASGPGSHSDNILIP